MKGKTKVKSSINLMSVLEALLIGIFGSILLIVSYIVLELSWLGSIVYNEGLKNIYLVQWALLICLIPAFTGALTAVVLSPQIKRYTYAIMMGMVAGTTAGIGFTIALSLLMMTMNSSQEGMVGWQTMHDSYFRNLAGIMVDQVSYLPYLLMFTLLSIMLSAVGGSAFYALAYYFRAKKSRAPGMIGKAPVRLIAYIAIALLVLAIIPPVAAFSGVQAGLVGPQKFYSAITVQRLGDDAIAFANNGGTSLNILEPGTSFIVYVGSSQGGNDLSNQQAAAREGLNVTLDPASGLGILPGSTLTIKGKSLADLSYYANNSTGKKMTHVYVFGNTTDGRQMVYLDAFV